MNQGNSVREFGHRYLVYVRVSVFTLAVIFGKLCCL